MHINKLYVMRQYNDFDFYVNPDTLYEFDNNFFVTEDSFGITIECSKENEAQKYVLKKVSLSKPMDAVICVSSLSKSAIESVLAKCGYRPWSDVRNSTFRTNTAYELERIINVEV